MGRPLVTTGERSGTRPIELCALRRVTQHQLSNFGLLLRIFRPKTLELYLALPGLQPMPHGYEAVHIIH